MNVLASPGCYRLCFRSLFHAGRGLVFPCDAGGHVDLDGLSERSRTNYLYARAVVGREYALPTVEATVPARDGGVALAQSGR